jgi:hypothetical protein
MEIMHACDIIPFQWPRKEKERKTQARLVVSKYLEPYFSTKSPPYLPILQNSIPSIVYVPCLCIQNHTYFYCAIQSLWECGSLR